MSDLKLYDPAADEGEAPEVYEMRLYRPEQERGNSMLRAILLSAVGKAVISAVAGAVTAYVGHYVTGQEVGTLGPLLGAAAAGVFHAGLSAAGPPSGPMPSPPAPGAKA